MIKSIYAPTSSVLSRWCAALMLTVFFGFHAMAQITIAGSTGTANGVYTSLTNTGGAFAALNVAGSHNPADVITISITADVLNEAGTTALNAGTWGSITITPTGARTISGITGTAAPLQIIDFNGADNVTVDGINSGGNSLTIANFSTSNVSGTSTIRFIGGATNNTITNCNIQGSGTMSVATNGATIFFTTDGVTANGNDNNTISNNDIGPAGANLPTKAILGNGSTTTTAIGNSGIIITNNDIHDYFGATVTSAGIATNGGCNTWSITNNRFYQTGTRLWTTGALHNAINIANTTATSGAQGFTITGNIVGYSSNTQTGTYTLTGSTGTFRGIVFNGINAGTVSNINSNTVAAVSVIGVTSSGTSSSSPFIAIYITNGVANSNSNTVGSQSATGSLVYSTNAASAADMIGIFNFSGDNWTANNNNIGGLTSSNAGAGAANAYGLRLNTSATATTTLNGNTIGGTVANSIQSTSTATGAQVAGIFISTSIATVSNNTIRNLTNAGGTGTTTAASVVGIDFISSSPVNNVTQNSIFNLSNTNTTAASVVTGIQFTGATGNVVERNLIYGLTSATNSATAEVNGIRVAGGTTSYRNNMIAIGAGITNAIGAVATNSSTAAINGINEALGTNSFFHNSVYIGGTATAGTGASFAFNGTQTTNTRSFRDNIFFNARTNSGATGKNYAVKINGTVPNPTGLTINNNLYFANGTGAVFGFFNSLDVANLAAWKTAVGQDALSFESNPEYNDPANATPDLHLHPTNSTVAEGNGADVGVANDYDGQTRSGLTPVDIGADAGNYSGVDLAPPVISYTILDNTISTANRPLSATITDLASGVPTSGAGLPVIYFRKGSSGAFSSTQATSGGGSTYNFTIDYSLVTGGSVTSGDLIQYYVMAQDGAASPNVASNPSSGASGYTANPPAAGTPPTTPYSYLISSPLTGTYTVPGSYPSLTNAGGIFEAINNNVVTGNINIEITADLSGELGTFGLNAFASPFTVKIYPTGVARSITGSFNGALIRANGSSRVTIDGSIGGAGTDRSLTISNTSVTSPSVVLFGSIGTTPITNNTLRNCIIINGINTSSAVVISDAGVLGNAGYFSNITIQNNDVQKAFVGVFATGGTNPQNGSNLTYTQNTVNTSGANAVRDVGLYMQGVNGATVSQNTVGNFSTVDGENDCGIWLATGTSNATISGNTVTNLGMTNTTAFAPIGIRESSGLTTSGNVISGNTVSNLTTNGGTALIGIENSGSGTIIEKNNVTGIINNNTGTFGAYGINISNGNNSVIRNNFVSNVMFNMTGGAAFSTQFGIFGIRIAAGTGHQVYFNSVNLSGPLTGTATTSLLSAAFGLVNTTSTGCDVRNNIFANNITGGTTAIAHVAAYLPSGGTSAMNLTWNNNAYFFGTDAARQGVGQAGTTAGTNFYTTLANLATYSSSLSGAATNDNASKASTSAVPFASSTDLHLTNATGTNYCFNGTGATIGSVMVDYDGETRATPPDIGADEFVAVSDAVATPASQTVCTGIPFTTILLSGSDASYNWSRNNAGTVTGIAVSGTGNISGTLTNTTNAQVTVTFTITPVDAVGCSGPATTATIVVDPGTNYYADNDGDGYGAGAAVPACSLTAGYSASNTDCDDTPVTGAAINPGATEVCNGIDDNCAGGIDEGVLTNYYADNDGDGYGAGAAVPACSLIAGYSASNTDCDDTPVTGAAINPGATEVCNGIDDNCAGGIDEGVLTNYYADNDGDGYGAGAAVPACSLTAGYSASNTDCDDTPGTGAAINPGATEVCNGIDDNCAGGIDEGVLTNYYADNDGDGYGAGAAVPACSLTAGFSASNTDCDDTPGAGAAINPGATEVCNGIDDNCAGGIDEGVQTTYYVDADGDTYGDPGSSTMACTIPIGYVTDNTDCDDTPGTGAAINPGATEVCNGIDDNCAGGIDEGVTTNYYADNDGDGYGAGAAVPACSLTAGYSASNTDCNDTPVIGSAINPGAQEICNSNVDDDCDGLADNADPSVTGQATWYQDADNDGKGNPAVSQLSCIQPVGYVANNTDCDDNSTVCPTPNPLGTSGITDLSATLSWTGNSCAQRYNLEFKLKTAASYGTPIKVYGTSFTMTGLTPGTKYNWRVKAVCDSVAGIASAPTASQLLTTQYRVYPDIDGDGYGKSGVPYVLIPAFPTAGYSLNNLDCNDGNSAIRPNAVETCNMVDDNCNTAIDEGLSVNTYYQDLDVDTYGNPMAFTQACIQPMGYVSNSGDCNDMNSAIKPGATEICNGVDDNCNGATDENGAGVWYQDLDGDGLGNSAVSQTSCTQPIGYVSNGLDCNDNSNIAVCQLPSGLNATNITTNSATLNWQSSPCVTYYGLQYKRIIDATWINVTTIYGGSFSVSGLIPNSAYQFRVRSRCNATVPVTTSAWVNGTFTTLPFTFGLVSVEEGQVDPTSISFDVYPNPGDGIFNILVKGETESEATVMLTDNLGRLVKTEQWSLAKGQNVNQLDLSLLNGGVYQVQILQGDLMVTKKIVLLK